MMFAHVRTLLWLKFILFKRTFAKGKRADVIISSIFSLIMIALSLCAGIALFAVGMALSGDNDLNIAPLIIGDVIVGFCVFVWFMAVMAEIQRSDIIDTRKMLILPISLRNVFFLNFAASLFTPSIVCAIPPFVGLIAGLAIGRGALVLAAIPIVIAFLFTAGAWTYYFRGLLVILMENKRRRRTIIVVLPIFFVLLFQMPNLIANGPRLIKKLRGTTEIPQKTEEKKPKETKEERRQRRKERERKMMARFITANKLIPLGWLPYGMHALVNGKPGEAALCMAGLSTLGALGFSMGYRSTMGFYRGTTRKKKKKKKRKRPARTSGRSRLIEKSIPFVDEDTSAHAMAGFVTYFRHPAIRIQFVMPVVMFVIVMLVFAGPSNTSQSLMRKFAPLMLLLWPFLGFIVFMTNAFGVDRSGFRALVLLPTPRWKYLFAKNLALFPLAGGLSALFVLVGALFLRLSISMTLISLMQVVQVYLLLCILGNFVSLYNPYPIMPDSMRMSPGQHVKIWMGLAIMFLMPVIFGPSALCMFADTLVEFFLGYKGIPIGLPIAIVFLALTAAAYRASLKSAGQSLMKREQKILEALVHGDE